MMRLRNDQGVQIVVTDDKAAKLRAGGTLPGKWRAVPASEQPPKEPPTTQPTATTAEGKEGHTDIASAIKASAGPLWDRAV